MSVIQLSILLSTLCLGTAVAWDQPTTCYPRSVTCTNEQHQLLRDNIQLVKESLEKDIQALRVSFHGGSVQCRLNDTDNSNKTNQLFNLETNVQMIYDKLQQQENELQKQNIEIEDLKADLQNLNISLNEIAAETISVLTQLGTFNNPASSCEEIPSANQPGKFWIVDSANQMPTRVFCNTSRSCGDTTREWTRVAYVDMTDPNQQCPDGLHFEARTEPPLRTCGRPLTMNGGCLSTTFPVNGIEYSRVYGRIRAYQDKNPDAFFFYYFNRVFTIDDNYVDGVSLTHGHSPRQHIWTFVGALDETRSNQHTCPCTRPDLSYTGLVPPFIGQDYFCETASRDTYQPIYYPDDPLWDGQGCGGNSTCCSFNNPPWFCKQLQQLTTDDIELRLCMDGPESNEDIPIEQIEIYVQ